MTKTLLHYLVFFFAAIVCIDSGVQLTIPAYTYTTTTENSSALFQIIVTGIFPVTFFITVCRQAREINFTIFNQYIFKKNHYKKVIKIFIDHKRSETTKNKF